MEKMHFGIVLVCLLTLAGCASNPSGPGDGLEPSGIIVFVSDRDGDCEVYSMQVDGSDLQKLTDNAVDDVFPEVSADGMTIAYCSWDGHDDEIWTMDADGGSKLGLTDNQSGDEAPAWNSDASLIAHSSERDGNWEIYIVSADGSNPARVTDLGSYEDDPDWSPDDSQIVVESDQTGDWEIFIVGSDGSGPFNVTASASTDGDPAWSPDGNKIAFISDLDGDNEIYTINTDETDLRQLTFNDADDQDPCWSPDGEFVAFGSDRDGDSEIYIMRADGSSQTRITNDPARDWWPSWADWRSSLSPIRLFARRQGTSKSPSTDRVRSAPPRFDEVAGRISGGVLSSVPCEGSGSGRSRRGGGAGARVSRPFLPRRQCRAIMHIECPGLMAWGRGSMVEPLRVSRIASQRPGDEGRSDASPAYRRRALKRSGGEAAGGARRAQAVDGLGNLSRGRSDHSGCGRSGSAGRPR